MTSPSSSTSFIRVLLKLIIHHKGKMPFKECFIELDLGMEEWCYYHTI